MGFAEVRQQLLLPPFIQIPGSQARRLLDLLESFYGMRLGPLILP